MTRKQLERTFRAIAEAAPEEADDWWIIGSGAMVLSAIRGVEPDDVDILTSRPTALGFLRHWRTTPASPKDHHRFRSELYTRVSLPGCHDVEVMGGLEVRLGDTWHRVALPSRLSVEVGNARLFVASISDQAALFRLFGREKDLAKAQICEEWETSGRFR